MNQIIIPLKAKEIVTDLRKNGETVVLTGGCFDILHPGHFALLKHAKHVGDVLLVLLESDEKITKLKGPLRPIHSQQERADMLLGLKAVDFVIPLPFLSSNADYDHIITSIHPDIIATTKNDPSIAHKQRQADAIGAKVLEVTNYIPHKSTSRLANILSKEN